MSRKKVFTGLMGTLFLLTTFLGAVVVVASAETTLKFWHPFTQATRMEAMEKSAREFEETHPGVTVVIETVPFTKLREKWTSAYAAGTMPDIMGSNIPVAVEMAIAGVLRPTDPIFEKMGGKDKILSCPDAVNRHYCYKGQTIAVPLYGVTRTPAYRRDLLREKGLMAPISWDEWLEVAAKLTDPPKQYGLVQMWDPSDQGGVFSIYLFRRSHKGTFFDENGKVKFNTPANIEAVKQAIELYKVAGVPGEFSFTMREYFNLFTSGKSVLSIVACGFLAPKFEQELPDLAAKNALGFVGAPVRLQRGWQTAVAGCVLPKGKNEQLADAFAEFLLQGDRYIRWVHAVPVGMIPVTNEAIQSPKYWDHPLIQKYADTVAAGIEGLIKGSEAGCWHGAQVGTPAVGNFGIIETMLQKIAIGQVNVEEGVAWAEKEIGKKMEELER